MAWSDLVEVLHRELGPTGAAAIDRALRAVFAGERIYCPSPRLDPEEVAEQVAAAPSVAEAARQLHCHRSTAYRLLQRRRIR